MLRQVYINKTVLEAAKERIKFIFDEFDNIIVSVSGGKDSTVLAHLALSEAHKRERKIGVFFLDEEVVYDSTIKQIEYIMSMYPENTIPLWLQIEFNLTNATSLTESQLKCWEAGKHKIWMRKKQKNSIQHKPWAAEKETVRDKNKGFGFYDALGKTFSATGQTLLSWSAYELPRARTAGGRYRRIPAIKMCSGVPRCHTAVHHFILYTTGTSTTSGSIFMITS